MSRADVAKVFIRLHGMHFSPAIIAKITSYSPQYVRQILDESGLIERWTDSGDVLSALPEDLVDACLKLREKGKRITSN